MERPTLKSVPETASLAALFFTPVLHLFVPTRWLDRHVALGLDLKDTITIAMIVTLALLLLAVSVPRRIRPYLRRGPYYESVEHSFFYQDDGTVTVRSLLRLNAGWQAGLSELPSEGFLWFNKIERDRLCYRLIHLGARQDRALSAEHPQISTVPYQTTRAGEGETSEFAWQPRISPPLRRFETVAYQVEVTTPGTETAAFHPDGTILGFGVAIPTAELLLRAFAPIGQMFEFLPPIYTIRDYATAAEIRVAPPGGDRPRLSVDRSVVEIRAAWPRAGRRYWLHYRFAAAGRSSAR